MTGGTGVFGLFLEIGFDAFHLSRAGKVLIPGGRPVFPQVPGRTPEEVLTEHGLVPGPATGARRDGRRNTGDVAGPGERLGPHPFR